MSENVANKDEALKCLGIARRALVEGDTGKADRFAQKALRLYRCQEVRAVQAHAAQQAMVTCTCMKHDSPCANQCAAAFMK